MSRSEKQRMRHRRREAQLRAATCRRLVERRGFRHAGPLVSALGEYMALSDQLPYPSQERLAQEIGVTDRTVRNWLVVLEAIGVVTVYRSAPKRQADGTYLRATNRYLLCDRRAAQAPPVCPLVRRRRRRTLSTTDVSPRGNAFPLTPTWSESGGVGNHADDPPNHSCTTDG